VQTCFFGGNFEAWSDHEWQEYGIHIVHIGVKHPEERGILSIVHVPYPGYGPLSVTSRLSDAQVAAGILKEFELIDRTAFKTLPLLDLTALTRSVEFIVRWSLKAEGWR